MPIPIAHAFADGPLHSSNKSILTEVSTKYVDSPKSLTPNETAAMVIDGQELVMGLG